MEWTYTISALSAAVKVFGSEEDEGESVNDPDEIVSLSDIESFQNFAKGIG